MKHNIILIGFMGSGKSTVGIRLSYLLRMPVVDTDKLIEKRAGKRISDIFAEDGEEAFRRQEKRCLQSLMEEKSRKILSTGGGLPLGEENREALKKLGYVVYLKAAPETIYERVKNDTTRPLLQTENPKQRIQQLLKEREAVYQMAADTVVEVDGKRFQEIIQDIRLRFYRWERQQREECQTEEARMKNTHATRQELKGSRKKKMKILVINGPNLNFLGIREKAVYGTQDYDYLLHLIAEKGQKENCRMEVFQSNHEGAIIDRLQDAYSDGTEGIVINPGAYTHYSYAIRDAIASLPGIPKVEVHISDITNREEFRKVSVTAPVCDKQIYGQGLDGYLQAIDFLIEKNG